MSTWSEDEIVALGDAAFRGSNLQCPRCKSRVTAHRISVHNKSTEDVDLICERCHASGTYETSHLAAMELKWNVNQQRIISDQYWRAGNARCPNDRAVLLFTDLTASGSQGGEFYASCPHCGRHFESNELIDPESFEAKYSTSALLGKGGMGQVDQVRRNSDGKEFAAKRILPQFLNSGAIVQRFRREIRICEKLDHQNVVKLHEVFLDEQGGIMIFDLHSGGALSNLINATTSSCRLAHLFREVVEGLAYIHNAGVVHRDLKPANVLVSSEGRACISDLGLARLIERDSPALTNSGFLGTPHYAAPEQFVLASEVTAKADIYSLGVIAYEICIRHCPSPLVNLTSLNPALASAILSCLAQNPNDRPDTGRALAVELEAAASE